MSGVNCLITGDRGFIGSALKEELKKDIYNDKINSVIGFDLLNDYPTIEVLTDFISTNNIQKIFHLGARAFIPDNYGEKIVDVINSNITFTGNLLVAAKKAKTVDKILYLSTSEIYGKQNYYPITEENPPNPLSTYAVSKFSAERLCRTFSIEADMDIVILRHFNVYGPNDKHPRIIPKLMVAAKNDIELKIGNTKFTRDFTYIDDAVKALINVMFDKRKIDVLNHGSGIETSFDELKEKIEKIYGKKITIITDEKYIRPIDVPRLVCDRRKYKYLYPEHNTISLEEGLEKTANWLNKTNKWKWGIE